MNRLVLIGNGFDLAHGLKTRYSDFILWYINKVFNKFKASENKFYSDNLIEIKYPHFRAIGIVPEFNSIQEFKEEIRGRSIVVDYKHAFFKDIIDAIDNDWVDIEAKYYETLIEAYKVIDTLNERYSFIELKNIIVKNVKNLNSCFDEIKRQLEEYLSTIIIDDNLKDKEIENHINKIALRGNTVGVMPTTFRTLFLNFNYTSTIKIYATWRNTESLINIHGNLNDITQPLIFGYGDEIDSYYSKLEQLNSNELLSHFKSFGYLKTKNYQDLIRFINSTEFEVHILGHSCGLSDRVLLNRIFEHKHCEEINIFYWQKSDFTNDYIEKTQEISRHFQKDKARMREIIKPLEESVPLKKHSNT